MRIIIRKGLKAGLIFLALYYGIAGGYNYLYRDAIKAEVEDMRLYAGQLKPIQDVERSSGGLAFTRGIYSKIIQIELYPQIPSEEFYMLLYDYFTEAGWCVTLNPSQIKAENERYIINISENMDGGKGVRSKWYLRIKKNDIWTKFNL